VQEGAAVWRARLAVNSTSGMAAGIFEGFSPRHLPTAG
jgi:hypothetical protein